MRSKRVPVVAGNLGGGREIGPFALMVFPDVSADMLLGFVINRLPAGKQRSGGLTRWCVIGRRRRGANRNIGSAGR
jgi:hypothetical protein